jgi:ATP-binding cassette, subfamily B, bacterial
MTPPKIGADGRLRLILALILLAFVQALATAVAALSTRSLFASLSGNGALPTLALFALAGSGVIIGLARLGFHRTGESLGQNYARSVRMALFDHASRMLPADVEARRAGYLSLRFVGDLTALKDWPARGLPFLVEGVVVLPVVIAMLFHIDWGFGWAGLLPTLISLAALGAGFKTLLRAHQSLRARRALLVADLSERMPIAPDLAALGRRPLETRLIARRSDQLANAAVKRATLQEIQRGLPEALTGIAAAYLIWWGWRGGLDSGTIAAGLALLGLAARPLRSLMDVSDRAGAFRAAHAKLSAALARPTAPARCAAPVRLTSGPFQLDLRGVRIAGGPPISLSLTPGARASLPKGTNVDVLFRAIVGQELLECGELTLNGVRVEDVSPGSLRRGVARITAMPVVLKGSLRRALTLGLTDRPSDKAIQLRLEKMGLSPLLAQLGGLERNLAEGARGMSRADRVGISILRTALARPGLLLVSHEVQNEVPQAVEWLAQHPATMLRAAA